MTRAASAVDLKPLIEEIRRFPAIFVHVGTLFDHPALLERAQAELAETGYRVERVQVDQAPPGDLEADCLLLVGFDRLADRDDRCQLLAQVRAWAMRHLEQRASVVLFSAAPKARLIGCPGSQLILDARTLFLHPLGTSEVEEVLRTNGQALEETQATRRFTGGLPVLVDARVGALQSAGTRAEQIRQAEEELNAAICRAVKELGWQTWVLLDESLDEGGAITTPADLLNPFVVEALRGAGLVEVEADGGLRAPTRDIARLTRVAVRDVMDGSAEPPPTVGAIVEGLWEVERLLRSAVKRHAQARHGDSNWREHALPREIHEQVLDRVRNDWGETVDHLRDVPNPLEWLTLDELLSIVEEPTDPVIPRIPLVVWRRVRAELLPIRNRIAHFRLPKLDDEQVVMKWRSELRRLLLRDEANS